MAYERTDTDNQLQKLQTLFNEFQDLPDVVPDETNIVNGLFSSGNQGDSFGELTGVKSDTPIQSNLTGDDEDGVPTGTTDRINLASSLTIVDYVVPIVNIDLRFINFKPANGSRIKFTPKVGRTLVIKTGGDFDIGADITIADNQYKEFIFLDATQTGIAGGGFVPAQDLSGGGGGGEFFGPWTADHNAGGFDLFGSSGVFLDASLLTGILFNAGGVGLIAPIGDTIDVFINNLVTPKFGFTETSLETNVPLNFANPGSRIITGIDIIDFDEVGQSIRGLSTNIRHDVPNGESHRFRVNVDEKMQIDDFGTNFDDNVFINDKIFSILNTAETHALQLLMNPLAQTEALITFTENLVFEKGITEIMELGSGGLIMHDSFFITMLDLLSGDSMQFSQLGGQGQLNYTGSFKISESGVDVMSFGGLLIQAEKDIDMMNNQIDNAFTIEIEENFTAGGVPTRPINGAKLFTRQQFGDATKNELRVYFQAGVSQLLASQP